MIPNSETSLSLFPAQRILLSGKAFEGTFYSGLGSLVGAFLGIFLLNFFLKNIFIIVKYGSYIVKPLLILSILMIIFNAKSKFWTIFIITFSAVLGFLSLNSFFLKYNLTVIFSGLFGAPALFFSFFNKIEVSKQNFKISFLEKDYIGFLKVSIFSSLFSFIASIFPGFGNSQAITFLSVFLKKIKSLEFVFGTSLINTLNFVLSIVVFIILGKSRNGVMLFFSNLNFNFINSYFINVYLKEILIVSIISFFILIFISSIFIFLFNYFTINQYFFLFLLISLILILFFLSGFYGLLFFLYAFSLGLLSELFNVKKQALLSVIIIPIIFLL